MDNPALPPDLDYRRRSGLFEGRQGAETRRNFRVRFMPCNPLISLDSDERIQGNPRKSNSHFMLVSERNSHAPRKLKRIDRTNVAPREAGQDPHPLPLSRREKGDVPSTSPPHHVISRAPRWSRA